MEWDQVLSKAPEEQENVGIEFLRCFAFNPVSQNAVTTLVKCGNKSVGIYRVTTMPKDGCRAINPTLLVFSDFTIHLER